ncbi:MAG TPA: DUF202 domain-containing protein [Coriobacteriia bacterium]|nr:DUF202 domain-containing protein [Coriobacteriia bacterium]
MVERPMSVYDDLYDLDEEGLDVTERLEFARTDWALQRTLWSAERTLNSWLRTAMAAVVAGLAIVQFVQPAQYGWMATSVGGVFVAAGVAMYVYGLWRYHTELSRLRREGLEATPPWVMIVIVTPLVLAAVLALFLMVTWSR